MLTCRQQCQAEAYLAEAELAGVDEEAAELCEISEEEELARWQANRQAWSVARLAIADQLLAEEPGLTDPEVLAECDRLTGELADFWRLLRAKGESR